MISLAIVIAVIFIICLIIGLIIYFKVKSKMRQVSNLLFDTDDLIEGINAREFLVENSPKSVSGMESLAAPRLAEDFPELSLAELKSRNNDALYEYYQALQSEDLAKFADSETLNAQLAEQIEQKRAAGIGISGLKVHKQALRSYRKTAATAVIEFQIAYEYMEQTASRTEAQKQQKRATTKWVYRLDQANFEAGATTSKACPNCGAPISGEGQSVCPYCSANIKVDYIRTWIFSAIEIE